MTPIIKSVDNMGTLLIDFNPPILNVTDDWSFAWQNTYFDQFDQNQQKWIEKARENILYVDYIRQESDFEQVKEPILIQTNLTLMSSGTISVQISFVNPLYVSESYIPDLIRIFLNKGFFRKRESNRKL